MPAVATVPAPRTKRGKRMCGDSRTEGSIYVEFGLGPGVAPVEDFLVDYPQIFPHSHFKLPNQGVRIEAVNGVYHVFDRVGEQYYPSPDVFVEEVKALGLSRKIAAKTPNLEKLGPGSMILLVHDKAWVNEWRDFICPDCAGHGVTSAPAGEPQMLRVKCTDCREWGGWACPQQHLEHRPHRATGCCAGLWWESTLWQHPAPQQRANFDAALQQGYRGITVHLPCGHDYHARRAPYGRKLTYQRAIFAAFPIHCLSVIYGRDFAGAWQAAKGTGLPVVAGNG